MILLILPLNSGIIDMCQHTQLLLYSFLVGGMTVEFILKLCSQFGAVLFHWSTWQCLEGIFTTKTDITSTWLVEAMDAVECPTVPNIVSCNAKLHCQHQS